MGDKKTPAASTGGGLILQQGQQPDNAQELGGLLHLFAAVFPTEGLQRHQQPGVAVGGGKGGDDLCDAPQQRRVDGGGGGAAAAFAVWQAE